MQNFVQSGAVFAAALFALVFAVPVDAGAQEVDLTGTWTFNVETPQGGGTPTVTLTQEGNALTGHYSSATLGEADLTGTVEGTSFMITFTINAQGASAPVTYAGTVDGEDSVSGTFDLGGMLTGTFTGSRQE